MSTCISMHGEYSAHTPDEDYICTRCEWLDEDTLIEQARRGRRLEDALRDIADNGLRADPNPTVTSVMDGGGTYRELTAYLRRLDSRIRHRARVALDGPEGTS